MYHRIKTHDHLPLEHAWLICDPSYIMAPAILKEIHSPKACVTTENLDGVKWLVSASFWNPQIKHNQVITPPPPPPKNSEPPKLGAIHFLGGEGDLFTQFPSEFRRPASAELRGHKVHLNLRLWLPQANAGLSIGLS